MRYVWNDDKRARTIAERGVDFAEIADFDWTTALTNRDERRSYGEVRYTSLGLIRGRLMFVAYTYRADACRIISMRKANSRERRKYERTE